jgi:glutamate/tyrosine decarboxylase-like PLP-dependent enzyme
VTDTKEERRSSLLEAENADVRNLVRSFVTLALEWLNPPSDSPVFPQISRDFLESLSRQSLPRAGIELEKLEHDLRAIAANSRHNNHPRMFGYIASPSTTAGAFATLLASSLNANVTSWRSSPAATTIERTVVRWLGELIGFTGESVGGLLTSGGSMANIIALYVAHRTKELELAHSNANSSRNASNEGLWGIEAPMTIYASDQAHLSIPKAADLLGLGRRHVRPVPSDDQFRIDVRALREMIESDLASGLRPFCVVANAGTVSSGAVDRLSEVAQIADEHSLWFHVDGAYGVLAAMTAEKRALFRGVESADSVSIDPHKWLYTPIDCGALLLRNPEHARTAFAATEEGYIKIFEAKEDEAFAFWDYGIELSRPFRALKVWTLLQYYGTDRIAAAIAEDCALAEYVSSRVGASEDFELLAPVTLGICCFRYLPARLSRGLESDDEKERASLNQQLNELNARIMLRVQRAGCAYISNAELRGLFALRASITNFRTTREDLDITLDAIRAAAREELRTDTT